MQPDTIFLRAAATESPTSAKTPERVAHEIPLPGVCTTSREFITTLEYLRSHTEYRLSDLESQRIARKVSQGCTGAAKRFIRVSAVLEKAELGSRDALETGIAFAHRSDPEAETFVAVFLGCFRSDRLDLSLATSVAIAKRLTSELGAVHPQILGDFQKMVEFCVKTDALDLPRPTCASFSARLVHAGALFEEQNAQKVLERPASKNDVSYAQGIFPYFEKLFFFLTAQDGPHLTTGTALALIERILPFGPASADNFIHAYRYGVSREGLALPLKEALEFSEKITLRKLGST